MPLGPDPICIILRPSAHNKKKTPLPDMNPES